MVPSDRFYGFTDADMKQCHELLGHAHYCLKQARDAFQNLPHHPAIRSDSPLHTIIDQTAAALQMVIAERVERSL